MIRITKKEVPQFLHKSAFYEALGDFEDDLISIPSECLKETPGVEIFADVNHLLKTLQFWGSDSIPEALFEFVLRAKETETEIFAAIFAEFDQLPQVSILSKFLGLPEQNRTSLAVRVGRMDIIAFFEARNIPFPSCSCNIAASEGHREVMKHFHQLGFPCDCCDTASCHGSLDCLKYAHEVAGACLSSKAFISACENGREDCMRYVLQQQQNILANESTRSLASQEASANGHLACLKVLLEYNVPISADCCARAAQGGHLDCLRLLHAHGVPVLPAVYIDAIFAQQFPAFQCVHALGCPWTIDVARVCADEDSVVFLHYALTHGCPVDDNVVVEMAGRGAVKCLRCLNGHKNMASSFTVEVFEAAAAAGNVATLETLFALGCAWDATVYAAAVASRSKECVRFLHEHGCPSEEETQS